jgi:gluconokinase
MIIVVMGVEGSGKTTVGALLADQLGWEFADGDSFHPVSNIEKIRHNIPLDDADRAPWLKAMHNAIRQWREQQRNAVLGCSVLKRSYREQLGIGPGVRLVYLKGDPELIARRLQTRHGHFAKPELLASQFAALEEPGNAITVDVSRAPEEIVREIRKQLGLT